MLGPLPHCCPHTFPRKEPTSCWQQLVILNSLLPKMWELLPSVTPTSMWPHLFSIPYLQGWLGTSQESPGSLAMPESALTTFTWPLLWLLHSLHRLQLLKVWMRPHSHPLCSLAQFPRHFIVDWVSLKWQFLKCVDYSDDQQTDKSLDGNPSGMLGVRNPLVLGR